MIEPLFDLSGYKRIVLISNPDNFLKKSVGVIGALMKSHNSGVVITVTHPYSVIKKLLDEWGVDTKSLYFIDCITTAASGIRKKSDNCLYISSPSALSEITIGIVGALEKLRGKKKFIFIDSLGTFLIYVPLESLRKFSHFLATKIAIADVDGFFMFSEKDMDNKVLSELQSFCEKTIRI